MPANNTTVNGVFKADPQINFSDTSGSAYIDAPQYNNLPTLSLSADYDGGYHLEAQDTEYAEDIVFDVNTPTIVDGSSAYTYIYDGNSFTAKIVAYAYGTTNFYPNYADYNCTFGLYNS